MNVNVLFSLSIKYRNSSSSNSKRKMESKINNVSRETNIKGEIKMTEYEKDLLNQIVFRLEELQNTRTKEEMYKFINNIILGGILYHQSDDFINEFFKIKQKFI